MKTIFRHVGLVVLLCALVYGNSLSGAFAWDDETQIVKNPSIRTLGNIPAAFNAPFWGFASNGAENTTNFYRPMQTLLYTLGYALGGLSPTPYHVISLTLHALASVFVYLICLQLLFPDRHALLAAALFAVHPVHTEAVAWIAGMADVACGAFYFAALWAFLKSSTGQKAKWLAFSSLLYMGALLSKEMAVTLPLLVFLLSFRPGAQRVTLTERLKSVAPFAAVTVAYLLMRGHALGFLANEHLVFQADTFDWITLGVWAFGQYVWYTLIPYPLTAFHLVAVRFEERSIPTIIGLLLVFVLMGLAFRFRKRMPEGWFWLASFAVLLIPVFYFKGISVTLIAERYLYIPSFAAVALAAAVTRRSLKNALALGWVAVAILGGMTMARNPVWNGSERLYTETLMNSPDLPHFQINLSDILLGRGDDGGARQHLEQALKSLEGDRYAYSEADRYRAEIGIGALDARARKFTNARKHFEQAREINPKGEWSYLYLGGLILEAESDYPKAIELFREAIRLGPLNEVARDYLGIALFNQGKFQEAADSFRQALTINPKYELARTHLDMATKKLTP